ncbi:uncharacterized protein cubi_02253 [Cryptosporidium ubiquitum]|uniref:Uncharacterized protein n=1 Tax=Cryptosporidium ubiquitum TaxID=857276 RepID=A0A1J4MFK9_9CRYT|nr:uncharacterized protein cubi_02253 [Cryptosporidium ubiquitum]OII73022.1 hypothetical protein cubi_02253 [Cryptosporidium ubiquitum]
MKGIRRKKKRVRNTDVKENHHTFNEEKKNYKKCRAVRSVQYSNVFLKKTFQNKAKFEMEDWIQLFLKSLIVKDFMSTIPHFRIFERMLSITSKHITGSKLKSFFAEFISRMEALDISVIPLFFEWCYVLYRQKLNLSKNQIRKNIRHDILRDALVGIVSGKARNYIIMLISCDLEISTKYLFPNSQISNWKEEFEEYFEDKYSLRDLRDDFWSFALQIFKSLAEENSIHDSLFEFILHNERTCLCKIDDWIIENLNRSTQIEWFKENSSFLSNNKLLLILFSSFINFFPFTLEFFPLTIELILNTKIEKCNTKTQPNYNIKSEHLDCSCVHNKISFNSFNEIYNLMMYLISSFIFIYYGIEYEQFDEFNLIYEESFNILHYLTSSGKNYSSSFYKYDISNHLFQIEQLINQFRKHPSLIVKVQEFSNQIINNNNSFIILVFKSILNIYKFRNKQDNLINNENYRKNEIFEEILITLLFLVILNPNTSDDAILYLFNSIYEELYSFGFLLIGSCMTLLYKKDIFPEGISKRVQLNISNFRSIHLINSRNFPYIQFMNCIYHLISRNIENFRVINMIFQLLEGNYLQYIRNVPQIIDSKKDREENNLSINISLTLTSIYMKLLEFFHLNPSLCKLFFEMKHYIRKSGSINQKTFEDSDFTNLTKFNPKVSLLKVFNQLLASKEPYISKNFFCEPEDKLIGSFQNINASNDLNIFRMNYTTMIHLLAILYIPVIKRVNMSLYKFKYSIYPSKYIIGEDTYFNDSECEFNDKIFEIEHQGVSIPKQFCIEFLEEVINYCKNLGIESPFDIDRFILKNAFDTSSININGQSISSLIHTCENDKNKKKCFVCCIDSYAEYLGIINAFQLIGEEAYQNYYVSKSWVNHAIIISIVTIINSNINIDETNGINLSEIKTLIRLSNKMEHSFYNNLTFELLKELINILINEIKDDTVIIKESGDPQRILFRSLMIYLLIVMSRNEIGKTILSNIDFHHLLVRLCYLFSFRIECLATNIYKNIETHGTNELINSFDGIYTPNIRRTPNSSNGDINDGNITPLTVTSKKSCNTITPTNKKRITPIIVSRNGSANGKSISMIDEHTNKNTNGIPNLALKDDTKSYSCIFHLKIILNAINVIRELIPQNLNTVDNKNDLLREKNNGIQDSSTEFVLNIMEGSLFFLLPSNTISKRSIFNCNIIGTNNEFNYQGLNTIHEGSESSEAEEIDNLSEIDKQSSQLRNTKFKIFMPTNIPYLLNDDDFSKDWYMEIVIYLIKFIINNTQLVKDISSIITDIASRITLWNRRDNKLLIFNVCVEVFKFSYDYFYDELPEISLCMLRNSGFQLLQSIKFVFVAILDQNSLLVDNTLNDLPSINAMIELESLHRVIFVFNNLVGIFEICFQILFFNGSSVTDRDNLWLRNAINLIEIGIETLSAELSKMERIKLPPKMDDDSEFLDGDENITNYTEDLEELKYAFSKELWNGMILECNKLLRECEYVHSLISSNWFDPNSSEQSSSNKQNKNCNIKEIDDDLDNFITFEQCDEGILQENESYSDIKLTPHWNTFIKSLFL